MTRPDFYFTKKPLSIDEQIEHLKNKNVWFDDELSAKKTLERVSYYRLKGYMLPFKVQDSYYSISFTKLMNILSFDQDLRSLILQYTEHIEITLKTFIIRAFTDGVNSNGFEYLDSNNFVDLKLHQKIIDNINIELERSHELYAKHYRSKYNSNFPIWVAVGPLSLGCIYRLFDNMTEDLQIKIASYYNNNGYYKIEYSDLTNYYRLLSRLRNSAAHFGRVYYKNFAKPFSAEWYKFNNVNTNKIFSLFMMMKHLCVDKVIWNNKFLPQLEKLISSRKQYISLTHVGFPKDWKLLLTIK